MGTGSRRDTSLVSPGFVPLQPAGCPCHGYDGQGGFGGHGIPWHCQPGTGKGSLARQAPGNPHFSHRSPVPQPAEQDAGGAAGGGGSCQVPEGGAQPPGWAAQALQDGDGHARPDPQVSPTPSPAPQAPALSPNNRILGEPWGTRPVPPSSLHYGCKSQGKKRLVFLLRN